MYIVAKRVIQVQGMSTDVCGNRSLRENVMGPMLNKHRHVLHTTAPHFQTLVHAFYLEP